MFMLNNAGATANAMPDVCKTPTPAGPVPMPYPNIATSNMADPGGIVQNVLVVNMPALNMGTKILLSNGDQAGAAGGVVSNKIMGETQFTLGSLTVMVGGKPAVRLGAMTAQNGSPPNAVGAVIAPSQTLVMVMS
mgnify:CR=1 FL=1